MTRLVKRHLHVCLKCQSSRYAYEKSTNCEHGSFNKAYTLPYIIYT